MEKIVTLCSEGPAFLLVSQKILLLVYELTRTAVVKETNVPSDILMLLSNDNLLSTPRHNILVSILRCTDSWIFLSYLTQPRSPDGKSYMEGHLLPFLQKDDLRVSTRRVLEQIVRRVDFDSLLDNLGRVAERIVAASQLPPDSSNQIPLLRDLLEEALNYLGDIDSHVRKSVVANSQMSRSTVIDYFRFRNVFEQLTLILCATVDFPDSYYTLLSRLSQRMVNLLVALLSFDEGVALVIRELSKRFPLNPTTKGTRLYLWAEVPCLNETRFDLLRFYSVGSRIGHRDLLREDGVCPRTLVGVLTAVTSLGAAMAAALNVVRGREPGADKMESTARVLKFAQIRGATEPFRSVSEPRLFKLKKQWLINPDSIQISIRLLAHPSIFPDLVRLALGDFAASSKASRDLINLCLGDPTTLLRPGVLAAAPRLQNLLKDYNGKLSRVRSETIDFVSNEPITTCFRRFLKLLRLVPDDPSQRTSMKAEIVWKLLVLTELFRSKFREEDGQVELIGQFERVAEAMGHEQGLIETFASLVRQCAQVLGLFGGQIEPTTSFDGIEGTQKIINIVLRRMVDSANQIDEATTVLRLGYSALLVLQDLTRPALFNADELAATAQNQSEMLVIYKHFILILTRSTLLWHASTCAIEQQYPSDPTVIDLCSHTNDSVLCILRTLITEIKKHPKGGDSISSVLVEAIGIVSRFPERYLTILRLINDLVPHGDLSRDERSRWCRQVILILPQLLDFLVQSARDAGDQPLFELLERINNLDPSLDYGVLSGLLVGTLHRLARHLDEAMSFVKGPLGYAWHLELPINLLRLLFRLVNADKAFLELEGSDYAPSLPDMLFRLSQREDIPSSAKQAAHSLASEVCGLLGASTVPASLVELAEASDKMVTDEQEIDAAGGDRLDTHLQEFAEAMHPSFLLAEPTSPFRPVTMALSKVYTGDEFRSSRVQAGPNVNRPNTSRPPSLHVSLPVILFPVV
jgi:hypothetical protein